MGQVTNEAQAPLKTMRLRYAGTCRACGQDLPARTFAAYDSATKTVVCATCSPAESVQPTEPGDAPFASGTAGASAQREFDKRHARRETRIRNAHPHLGGVMLALTDDPQSTTAWQKGARGEVRLGKRLDTLRGRGIHVLHDRRIPGSKAKIDHLVVAPRGAFVIDAKKYTGQPRLQVEGGLFRARTEKLMVGSRDQTKLAAGVHWQMGQVDDALANAGFAGVPVFGMLCFVDADWPLLGGSFVIDGVDVLWPSRALTRVSEPGSLDTAGIEAVARALAVHFRSA